MDQVPDENILDAISVSSVDLSDLSSDDEDTKPDDDEKRDTTATATAAADDDDDDIGKPKIDDSGVGENNPNNNKNDDGNDKDGDYSTP